MHPLIFIPEKNVNPTMLDRIGLSSWRSGAFFETVNNELGTGTLVTWPRPGFGAPSYEPSKQKWMPAEGRYGDPGRYIIGLWNDSPCTPQDLVLPKQQHGELMQLEDGNYWLIPRMRDLDAFLTVQGDEWVKTVKPEYAALQHQALLMIHEIVETKACNIGDLYDCVFRILQVNYRLTIEMVNQMHLLTDQLATQIFMTFVRQG